MDVSKSDVESGVFSPKVRKRGLQRKVVMMTKKSLMIISMEVLVIKNLSVAHPRNLGRPRSLRVGQSLMKVIVVITILHVDTAIEVGGGVNGNVDPELEVLPHLTEVVLIIVGNDYLTSFLVVVMVAFMVLLERKLLRGLQLRTGPLVVGVFGVLQTLVDGVKLVFKGVYKFNLSGVIFIVAASCVTYFDSLLSMLIGLVVLSYAFLLGVYSVNNMYAILGRYRAVVVIIAFDVVMLIALITDISLLICILLLFIFSSESGRTPIDLVERESELVSGFNTEYSGVMFVCYFLGEYMIIIIFFVIYLSGLLDFLVIVNLIFVIF